MAIDPLSEVYAGKDNSGSAYVLPSSRRSPVDTFFAEAQKRQVQKKALDETYAKMGDLGNYKAWDRDLPMLQKMRSDYTTLMANMYKKGVDPRRDPAAWKQLTDMRDQLTMTAMASAEQKDAWNAAFKDHVQNPDHYDPQSIQNIHDWASLPIDQRTSIPDMGIVPYRDHNYIKYFHDMTAGEKFAKKSGGINMDEVKGGSPYYTQTETTTFDEEAARKSINTIINKGGREMQQLHDDVYNAMIKQGKNPTQEEVVKGMQETLLPIAKARVEEENKTSLHFKPKPSVINVGDSESGNQRYAWGAETRDYSPDAAQLVDKMGIVGGKTAMVDRLNKVFSGKKMRSWSIKSMSLSDNTEQVYSYKENGVTKKVSGKLMGVEPIVTMVNGKPKIKYVVNVAEPDQKNPMAIRPEERVIPGKIKQIPYDQVKTQVEVDTRGKKGEPGFDLDTAEPTWKDIESALDQAPVPEKKTSYQKVKEIAKNTLAKLKWPTTK